MNRIVEIGIKRKKAGGPRSNNGFLAGAVRNVWDGAPIGFIIVVMCTLGMITTLGAHSDVDPEIAEITKKLADQPNNVELLWHRGQLYRFNGKLKESFYDLEKAWLLDPDNRKVSMERCRTLVALGYDHEAEPALNQLLQGESGSSRVTALVERAHLYARTKRPDLAIRDFSEALNFYPTVEIYMARGHLQEELGQLDAAAAGYREGLGHLGQAGILRRELIRVEMDQGHYPNALTLIDEELRSASVKTDWYLKRAAVLAAMGQTAETDRAHSQALAEANRALARRPTALHLVARAKVYQAQGQLEAAKQDLRLAVDKAPQFTEAQDLLKKLEAQ
jgi:tetratricopeptide (TPR) repeat protein